MTRQAKEAAFKEAVELLALAEAITVLARKEHDAARIAFLRDKDPAWEEFRKRPEFFVLACLDAPEIQAEQARLRSTPAAVHDRKKRDDWLAAAREVERMEAIVWRAFEQLPADSAARRGSAPRRPLHL